ncbi:response regulator [Bradyrhizobium sp. OAE829]|uniref:response regulator transcription factor n=1 Tax=Bradyrhizobium sp. OAE829 TaxID=2663807 RepID=UPI00178A8782
MTNGRFTVFLVDDDAGVLKALDRALQLRGYEVRSFTSPQAFLASHDASAPGCAVLDVAMPDLDGLALQHALTAEGSQRPVIFLTGEGDIPTSVRAMRAGAVDFLTKPVSYVDLLAAIARAEKEDLENRAASASLNSINARLAMLTPREREVMTHVVAGRLNKQIAGDIGTVEKTVKLHRGRMMRKLGVRSVADLVRLAERAGITAGES